MTKPVATLLIGLCLAAAPACGRKGPLELPPGRAPLPVEAMTAVPGPGTVLLRWTNPAKAVSGRPVGPLDAVEIWVFDRGLPVSGRPLTPDVVEKTARLVRRIPRREFGTFAEKTEDGSGAMAFSFDVGPQAPAPTKLAFTVRVFDRRGRASDFSPPVAVDVVRKDTAAGGVPR